MSTSEIPPGLVRDRARRIRSKSSRDRKREQERVATNPRQTLVRNRDAGEPLRPAQPIKCQECCDMSWRRVDRLCRPGDCFACGQPYQAEEITPR